MSSTMAILRPAIQLKRDDLPTFGRPTITTLGSAIAITHLLVWRRDDAGKAGIMGNDGNEDNPIAHRPSASLMARDPSSAGTRFRSRLIIRRLSRNRQMEGWNDSHESLDCDDYNACVCEEFIQGTKE
jgi:hypothetical protein